MNAPLLQRRGSNDGLPMHTHILALPAKHPYRCCRAVDPGDVKTTAVDHGRIRLSCVFCRKNIRLHAATLNQPTMMNSATCISCYLAVTIALNLLALQIALCNLQRLFPVMPFDVDLYLPLPFTKPVWGPSPVRRTALHPPSPSVVCGKRNHASNSHVPPHQLLLTQSCISSPTSPSNSFPPLLSHLL